MIVLGVSMTLEDANSLILWNALFSGSMRKGLEMKGMKLNPVMVLSKERSALEIGKHGNKGLHTTTLARLHSVLHCFKYGYFPSYSISL